MFQLQLFVVGVLWTILLNQETGVCELHTQGKTTASTTCEAVSYFSFFIASYKKRIILSYHSTHWRWWLGCSFIVYFFSKLGFLLFN